MNKSEPPPQRYFVEVYAGTADGLRRLREYGYDLFAATARETTKQAFAVEGLLTLDQVGRLVHDGYQVLVGATMESRARARTDISEFPEWLAQRKRR